MTILLILSYIVALPVLVCAINVLNEMDRCTKHCVRLGYMVVALGALAVLIGPFFGRPESWTSFLMLAGCALILIFDRRAPFCEVPANAKHFSKR